MRSLENLKPAAASNIFDHLENALHGHFTDVLEGVEKKIEVSAQKTK
jgi:hypothetical protein